MWPRQPRFDSWCGHPPLPPAAAARAPAGSAEHGFKSFGCWGANHVPRQVSLRQPGIEPRSHRWQRLYATSRPPLPTVRRQCTCGSASRCRVGLHAVRLMLARGGLRACAAAPSHCATRPASAAVTVVRIPGSHRAARARVPVAAEPRRSSENTS